MTKKVKYSISVLDSGYVLTDGSGKSKAVLYPSDMMKILSDVLGDMIRLSHSNVTEIDVEFSVEENPTKDAQG